MDWHFKHFSWRQLAGRRRPNCIHKATWAANHYSDLKYVLLLFSLILTIFIFTFKWLKWEMKWATKHKSSYFLSWIYKDRQWQTNRDRETLATWLDPMLRIEFAGEENHREWETLHSLYLLNFSGLLSQLRAIFRCNWRDLQDHFTFKYPWLMEEHFF